MKSHIAIAFLLAVIGAASSQSAGRCDPNVCRLPRCYCGGTEVCKMMCSNLDTSQLLSLVETRFGKAGDSTREYQREVYIRNEGKGN